MIDVIVTGAAGRMGLEVVAAVSAEDDMRVVARLDPALAPDEGVFADLPSALASARPQVLVDFTRPETVAANTRAALAAGVHAVVGTTGMSDAQVAELAEIGASAGANLLVAPNFAIGAVLMMRFAREASRHLPKAEIVELHHDGKLDAPSGTAIRTAAEMDGEVPIHSVRLPGLVAHQEVILGGLDETLTIRHDTLSRRSFMPGVVLAVREVGRRPGLTGGIEGLVLG